MEERRRLGYIRVSSKYQNEARQRDALLNAGVLERDLFIDRQSGKDFERPEYAKMMSMLCPGDEVVILDLDRLGRNYTEMAYEWEDITRDKECDITVINYPLLSTVQEEKSLDKRFIANIIFQLLSYVAEKEREDIKSRQREGIDAAIKRGTKFGRPKVERPSNFSEVYRRVFLTHEITNKEAQRLLNLKESTYYAFARAERETIVKEMQNERS